MSSTQIRDEVSLLVARRHARRSVPYVFSELEQEFLTLFFSNHHRHTFLVFQLPANVLASLLAMYSRIKDPRGLRGVFLDTLLVYFLASQLPIVEREYLGDTAAFLKQKGIKSFADLMLVAGAKTVAKTFLRSAAGNPQYVKEFAQGKRIKDFLATYLDGYGHTSIARLGSVAVCCENISLLAAKAIEHPRPGAGFIEVSTRYVDMRQASLYPFIEEWRGFAFDASQVTNLVQYCSDTYTKGMEIFQDFLRPLYADATEGALFGEACDVVSNLLPAATLTSVGACVSGESLRSLLRCLYLEGLPETTALADLIRDELATTGLDQFARHIEPTEWDMTHIKYAPLTVFRDLPRMQGGWRDTHALEEHLWFALETMGYIESSMDDRIKSLTSALEEGEFFVSRSEHDKLPPLFEHGQLSFRGLISFRSWRDFQRHTLSSNERTLLTPWLGFYHHDKPLSPYVEQAFDTAQELSRIAVGNSLVPELLQQYMLPLGFNVGFLHASNLRQLEFLCWQRSGANVNHEVRRVILAMNALVLKSFPWWEQLSRTDRTPKYRLAREKAGVAIA